MAHIPTSEDEVKPLNNKPKLTMKYLHMLILEIQQENVELLRRIKELEQQLSEVYQSQSEAATATTTIHEQLSPTKHDLVQETQKHETQKQEIHNQHIRISRSERHTPSRKKSFWFL